MAITNSVWETFPDANRLFCWAHVIRNLHAKFPKEDRDLKNRVYTDLNILQRSFTPQLFRKAYESLFVKYSEYSTLDDFFRYFKNNYILNNNKWYEGACLGASKTNNALEAFNLIIKKVHLNYNKQSLKNLIMKLGEILKKKEEQLLDRNLYLADSIIYKDEETSKYDHELIGNEITTFLYWIRKKDQERLTPEHKERINNLFLGNAPFFSFREYKELLSNIFVLWDAGKEEDWKCLFCSCRAYKLYRKCGHILFMGRSVLKLKKLQYSIAKPTIKRKKIIRGSALVRETP